MPQLPVLETLVVKSCANNLSNRLADTLLSIRSAPQLSLVSFTFPRSFGRNFPVYNTWRGVDNWLVLLARSGSRERDGLKVEYPVPFQQKINSL